MKNILIIVANPREDSLSFAIANRYRDLCIDTGNRVDIVDLYQEENQQPFFTYENAHEPQSTKEMKYFQKKIQVADKIVFVFPYWWGGVPAILKNFIDWNFSLGFALEFTDDGSRGLLNGKKVKVFVTAGSSPQSTEAKEGLKNMFKENFEFCAMELESFDFFDGVDMGTRDIEKLLEGLK